MGEDSFTTYTWACDSCSAKGQDTRSSKPPDDWRWQTWPSETRDKPNWHIFCPACYIDFCRWWDKKLQVPSPKGSSRASE